MTPRSLHTLGDRGGDLETRMRLRATAYLSSTLPTLPIVTSVRAVVLRAGTVLFQLDRDSRHILPGDRREGTETLEETLRREVAEETGWSLGAIVPLGFTHFEHLDSEPEGYAHPHPPFLPPDVYVALAGVHVPEAKLDDGYEVGTTFLPIAAVRRLPPKPIERLYQDAAESNLDQRVPGTC
jgi:ADP-ribose pyrophosphatase YjhB (NUDIX family)